MKSRYILIATMLSVLFVFSCTEEFFEPVESCSFTESTDNATNPYSDLYQQVLDDYIKNGIPGISIAVETPEHGWWVGCSGMASIEEDEKLKSCHLFHSASMAKTYTATMIMRLVEDEIICLDDGIAKYLPEEMISRIANGDTATIRQCLSHTAGFEDVYFALDGRTDVLNNPLSDLTLESRFEKFFYDRKAIASPGEKFEYSGAGFDLVGLIIEKVSGMPLGEYFEKEIIEPIGLVNTYYKASPGYPNIDGLVNGYMEHYSGKLQNCSDIDMKLSDIAMGHAGVIATPYEYARFYQELMRGNILNDNTLAEMLKVEWKAEEGPDYCLGIYHWDLEHGTSYLHSGMLYGILSVTRYYPDSDITISICTNLGGIFKSKNVDRFQNLRKELVNVAFTGSRN